MPHLSYVRKVNAGDGMVDFNPTAFVSAYGRIPPNQLYECATQLICLTERSGTLP